MAMRTRTTARWTAVAAAAVAAVATAMGPSASAGSELIPIATGLNNPRGITVAVNGDIFVAESGVGGDSDICFPNPEGPGADVCYGPSGSITRIPGGTGTPERVVTGLASMAGDGGFGATGPSDVVAMGSNRLAIVLGLGADPALRDAAPAQVHPLGTVVEALLTTGRQTTVADVAAHEATDNPVAGPDSNPTSLVRWGSTYVVTDAGGNTAVRAKRLAGGVSTMAVVPGGMTLAPPFMGLPPGTQIPYEAVPTSVTRGPDGAFYLGQLTGFPFPQGGANIWRMSTNGSLSVYASGLNAVTDLEFASDGTLYAVELSADGLLSNSPGALVQVPAGSTSPTLVVGGLDAPYGLAISGHTAYVTTGSTSPGGGQVVAVPIGN